jgi:hypothetical protein
VVGVKITGQKRRHGQCNSPQQSVWPNGPNALQLTQVNEFILPDGLKLYPSRSETTTFVNLDPRNRVHGQPFRSS